MIHKYVDSVHQMHYNRVMSTSFKHWREDVMKISQERAAILLEMSLSQVKNYDAGVNRASGRPAIPDIGTRLHMRILADRLEMRPWPE